MSHCYFVASDQPRMITGRHDYQCHNDECRGCEPCLEPKCRVCNRTHAEGTCAECLAEVRDNLRGIGRMCDALPEEVEHRGVEGEAMVLLGPVSDPEAWGHVTASVASGRLAAEWVEEGGGELHPLTVMLSWSMVYREALDHSEAEDATLATAVDYLDRNLSYFAGYPWVPFEDAARDLRRCAGHLEAVLHDGEQVDTGAPCLQCQVPLRREWGRLAASDGWRCPRCREWRSDVDYRLNVAQLHNAKAEWLTDRDMETRTGIKAGTVRSWSRDKHDGLTPIAKRLDSGRTLYRVAEVRDRAKLKGLLKDGAA